MRAGRLLFSGLVLMACSVNYAHALDWQSLWQRPDQVAYKKLQAGDSSAAAEIFDDSQWRGVSQYRAGQFEEAQSEFSNSESESAVYNQAVTAVQQGEYDSAIEKFESLLSQNPEHPDAQHNLEIARELARQQEQQQQQEQQGGDQNQQSEEQNQQDQENQSEGDGESASNETGDTDSSDKKNGGDLTTSAEDAAEQQSDGSSPPDDEQVDEQQSEQGEQEVAMQPETDADEIPDADNSIPGTAAPTESEQATEQWLRRIPDDPSQLLRNKIKLNHMIEHADVRDMREPW